MINGFDFGFHAQSIAKFTQKVESILLGQVRPLPTTIVDGSFGSWAALLFGVICVIFTIVPARLGRLLRVSPRVGSQPRGFRFPLQAVEV